MKLSDVAGKIGKGFSGVVSIVHKGEPLLCESHGYADIANQIPNRAHTRFATASAGKAFVAAAVVQLIGQEELGMNSSIGSLLDFDLGKIDPAITVRQLLSHTSGIPDYFDEETMSDYGALWEDYPNYKIRANADLIPLFIGKPMAYPAGERFRYNNTGYAMLGMIIERVAGMAFDEYLRRFVFAPCGMVDTGYFALDHLPDRCANAYIFDENGEWRTNIYSVDVKGTGAGGAFSTVADVEAFWAGLLGGVLLPEPLLWEMFKPQNGQDNYGYGFWLDRGPGGYIIPHFEGCDPGVSFYSACDVSKNLIITLASNIGSNVWQVYHDIAAAFAGQD